MSADPIRRAFEKWHKAHRHIDRNDAWVTWQAADHAKTIEIVRLNFEIERLREVANKAINDALVFVK